MRLIGASKSLYVPLCHSHLVCCTRSLAPDLVPCFMQFFGHVWYRGHRPHGMMMLVSFQFFNMNQYWMSLNLYPVLSFIASSYGWKFSSPFSSSCDWRTQLCGSHLCKQSGYPAPSFPPCHQSILLGLISRTIHSALLCLLCWTCQWKERMFDQNHILVLEMTNL